MFLLLHRPRPLPNAWVCFVRDRILSPIRMYSTIMTAIGMTKNTHVDTSQSGKPPGLPVNMAQNAESEISESSAKEKKKEGRKRVAK